MCERERKGERYLASIELAIDDRVSSVGGLEQRESVCVCVYVCVCERERERARGREREREGERGGEREIERKKQRWGVCVRKTKIQRGIERDLAPVKLAIDDLVGSIGGLEHPRDNERVCVREN